MILVTGSTGFLGAHLLFHLLKKGETVLAMKRADSSFTIINNVFKFYNSQIENYNRQLSWVDGDVTDVFSVSRIMESITDVYHCAAVVSFQPGDQNIMDVVNVKGTENMVNIALEKKIRKFCFVSSIAAIGRTEETQVIDENNTWKASKNNSRYAVSKYGAEREVWRAVEEGLNAVIVNPSIILGPGEINSGSTKMIKTVEKGLKFYTPGINGFVDVRDVVNIMINLMGGNISAQRFIVSSENVNYKTLFGYIAKYLDKPVPKYEAKRWMGGIVWRLEFLKSKLTGNKPLITKETARTAAKNYVYSNKKSTDILSFNYMPVEQSIRDACYYFKDKLRSQNT